MRRPNIVVAGIEPINGKKLILNLMSSTARALTAHEPGTAPPDFDHPITKALVEQLPDLSYRVLEQVRAHLMKHDSSSLTNARHVDGWLRLVNAELQQRDRDRQKADISLVELLTSKGIIQ